MNPTSFGPELQPDHYEEPLSIETPYGQGTMHRPAELEDNLWATSEPIGVLIFYI
jgi:hypothetical protein